MINWFNTKSPGFVFWFIFAVCGLCGMVIPCHSSAVYTHMLGPLGFPMMGWPPIKNADRPCVRPVARLRRMCVITEAKKLGVFADIMDKVQNPALRAIFWERYIYIYIIQYVISCGQTTITWCFLACWPAKNWLIHSELKSATSIAWWPLAIRHRSAFFSPAVWAQERHCRILQSSLLYLWDVIEIVDSSWCSVVVNLLQVWFSHVFTRLESYGKRKHQ